MKTNLVILALALAAAQANATLLYNHNLPVSEPGVQVVTKSGPDYYDPETGQPVTRKGVGNQVVMGYYNPETPIPVLSSFSCSYWSTETVSARLTFYANDGAPYGPVPEVLKPGSVLWQGGWTSVDSTAEGTFTQNWAEGLELPSDEFTWALEFGDLSGENTAGLLQMNSTLPISGDLTYPYAYWSQAFNGSWYPKTANGANWDGTDGTDYVGFAASIEGELVPEPGVVAMMLVTVGGGAGYVWRRKAKVVVAAAK